LAIFPLLNLPGVYISGGGLSFLGFGVFGYELGFLVWICEGDGDYLGWW
jgi:hypothetical protein